MATGFRDYHKLFSSITETRYVPCFHLCIFIPASIVNQAKVNSSLAVLMWVSQPDKNSWGNPCGVCDTWQWRIPLSRETSCSSADLCYGNQVPCWYTCWCKPHIITSHMPNNVLYWKYCRCQTETLYVLFSTFQCFPPVNKWLCPIFCHTMFHTKVAEKFNKFKEVWHVVVTL